MDDVNLLSDKAKKSEEAELARLQDEKRKMPMSSPDAPDRQREPAGKTVEPHALPPPPPKRWLERLWGSRVHALRNPAIGTHRSDEGSALLRFSRPPGPSPKEVQPSLAPPSSLRPPVQPPPGPPPPSIGATPSLKITPSGAGSLPGPLPAGVRPPPPPPIRVKPVAAVRLKSWVSPLAWFTRRRAIRTMLAVLCLAAIVGSAVLQAALRKAVQQRLAAVAVAEQTMTAELATYAASDAEAAFLRKRLQLIAQLLERHVSLRPLTKLLEETVLPTVQYTRLVVADERHVELSGLTVSFEDVAKQQVALAGAPAVAAVRLTRADYDANQRLVNFTLALMLRPETLRYGPR